MARTRLDPRFGARMRDLRAQRRLSYRALEKLVNYSYGYLCQIENGHRLTVDLDVVKRLGAALDAEQALLELTDAPVELDGNDRERLAHVAANPRRVDEAVLGTLDVVLAGHRRLEDVIGPGAMYRTVAGQLELAEAILTETPGGLRRRALDLTAQQAQYTGWLTLATARRGAHTLFKKAERLASDAGNGAVRATVLSFIGYSAHLAGRPAETIAASEAALAVPGISPRQSASTCMQVALGYAMRGETRDVWERVAQHRDLATLAAEWDGSVNPWEYYYTPAFLALERARVLALVAQHTGEREHAETAISGFREALAAIPPDQCAAQWVADPFLMALADVQAGIGDRAGAQATAREVQRIAASTGSVKLARRAAAVVSR